MNKEQKLNTESINPRLEFKWDPKLYDQGRDLLYRLDISKYRSVIDTRYYRLLYE